MTYFAPMPPSSLNMNKVNDYVQRHVDTFYRAITFQGGDVTISSGGSLSVGGPVPAGASGQFFLHATQGHLAMLETDDADYPDVIWFMDVNAHAGRFAWIDELAATTVRAQFLGPNHATRAFDVDILDSNEDVAYRWDDSAAEHQFFTGGAEVASIGASGVDRSGEPAYLYKETIYYTSNNTFTKADYPGLRAVRVQAQGGGGAGGGCAVTGSDQWSAGAGGNGGGYAESWILAADLDTNEAVTVGAGGTPGAAGANSGGNGADSVFDTVASEVRGVGGTGGNGTAAVAGAQFIAASVFGAAGGTGDLIVTGGAAGAGMNRGTATVCAGVGGAGGGSHLAGSLHSNGSNTNGATGQNYGGGGTGGCNSESQATGKSGGAGGPGIVIVHVYV